jgi:hypothetical protein
MKIQPNGLTEAKWFASMPCGFSLSMLISFSDSSMPKKQNHNIIPDD